MQQLKTSAIAEAKNSSNKPKVRRFLGPDEKDIRDKIKVKGGKGQKGASTSRDGTNTTAINLL